MPWTDLALAAIWTAALIYAIRYWLRSYRRDDISINQQRDLLKEIRRHTDNQESGQP